MKLLLDTQVYLWFLAGSTKLSRKARDLIATADEVFVSAATIWESAIKIGIGKLRAAPDDLVRGIAASGFTPLVVSAAHGAAVATLVHHHRDPFDRVLIAQATVETMRLLTADKALLPYSELVVFI